MRVAWTDRAKHRLRELHDYIAQDSPAIAAQVVRQLVARSRHFGDLPNVGRQVPEYARIDVRELLVRPYRIIYRVDVERDRIDVLTVRHYRQLLPSDLVDL